MTTFGESTSEAWKSRFGTEAPINADQLHRFFLHRSVRKYSNQGVEESTVAALMGAAQSAATSSNLQMWSVVSIQEPALRKEIGHLCDDQDQVLKAPWFFAFLADHHRVRHAAQKVGEAGEGLGYTEFLIMAVIDAALAAERFVCAAESLGLGTCYIGALRNDPPGVKRLLGLPDGVFGVFGLTLGWPEEPSEAKIRPRLTPETVWFKERYEEEVDLSGFETRMKEFYENEQMKGDLSWSKRSGRRLDRHHLNGREVLRQWLEEQGINRE